MLTAGMQLKSECLVIPMRVSELFGEVRFLSLSLQGGAMRIWKLCACRTSIDYGAVVGRTVGVVVASVQEALDGKALYSTGGNVALVLQMISTQG